MELKDWSYGLTIYICKKYTIRSKLIVTKFIM